MLTRSSRALFVFAFVVGTGSAGWFATWAQDRAAHDVKGREGATSHVMLTPEEVAWKEGPASLPPGAQAAVLDGDPSKPGPFTLRLKTPADYRIPPHWHPADEHVTVLSGRLFMGMGDKLDSTKSKALPPGGFAVMPATSHHYAYTTEETILQLHGIGPWGIEYVDPSDDPRKKK
jgi:mannose-6-phosphate isomerase-like protein (cupin superfamily)